MEFTALNMFFLCASVLASPAPRSVVAMVLVTLYVDTIVLPTLMLSYRSRALAAYSQL